MVTPGGDARELLHYLKAGIRHERDCDPERAV